MYYVISESEIFNQIQNNIIPQNKKIWVKFTKAKHDNNFEGICISISKNLDELLKYLHFQSNVRLFQVFVYKSETSVFIFFSDKFL